MIHGLVGSIVGCVLLSGILSFVIEAHQIAFEAHFKKVKLFSQKMLHEHTLVSFYVTYISVVRLDFLVITFFLPRPP